MQSEGDRPNSHTDPVLSHQLLLEALVESVLDGVLIISLDGKILHCNQSFLEIWKFPQAIIDARLDERALQWAAQQTADPAGFLARVAEVYGTADDPVCEELVMKDGRVYERYSSPLRMKDTRLGWVWTFRNITGRKRAEEALRVAHDTFRHLVDYSPFGIYAVDADFRLVQVSAGAQKVFQNVRPLLGRDFAEVLRVIWTEPFASEAIGRFRQTLATGEPYHAPSTVEQRHDIGQVESYDWKIERVTLPDGRFGAVCHFYDLSERQRYEAALEERESRLRLALAGGQMGTWDMDLQSNQITWDARGSLLLGYTEGTAASTDGFYGRVHPDDRLQVKEALRRAVTETGELEHEFRIVRPDGQVRWLVGKGVVLKDDQGCPARVVGINYEITERKRTEEALRRNEEQLRSFAQELEAHVEDRTRELRQSQERLRALAAELNLAEQRERKRLAAELHDHLQQILVLGKLKLAQGKRVPLGTPANTDIFQHVDDLLSEALAYTRTLVAELSPPVLRDHGLAAGLKWLGEYMTKHDMTVAVSVPADDELTLPEDQTVLLFQSVRELLMNSWKHAGTYQATVTMERQDKALSIEVRDEGNGFDRTAAGIPNDRSSKFGLFSIRERMKALGGSFHVESAPGRGTRSVLELPLPQRTNAHVQTPVPLAVPSIGRTASPRKEETIRVLLVDDHVMMRQGLRSVLDGYRDLETVAEAADGEEAVLAVERFHPAVVVMDINMPKMNGIEATARIKAKYQAVHVIGLSVNPERDNQEAMRHAGAEVLLTKEAAVEQLYSAIQRVMVGTNVQA